MGESPSVLDQVLPLARAGLAIHWLRPRSKAPLSDAWSTAAIATPSYLERTYRDGYNAGVRLGEFSCVDGLYLHLIDLDIRRPEHAAEARAELESLLPGFAKLPTVRSGSGGDSRHFYLLTDKPFGSRKLARSVGFDMVFDPGKNREVKKRHWEIELFGTKKQAAIPPSIHPDTGKPYAWEIALDLSAIDLGVGPIVDSSVIESWGVATTEAAPDDAEVKPALGLSIEEAEEILSGLPIEEWCEDRDGWLQVGMALHHEFDGSDDGLDLWNSFSEQSGKFDPDDQERVWRSFRKKTNSVRMATLKKAAGQVRVLAQFEDLGDDEDDIGQDEGHSDDASDLFGDLNGDDASDLFGEPEPEHDTFTIQPATNPENKEWRSLLHFNEDATAIRPTLHNVDLIVRHDKRMRGVVAFNQFTQEVVYRGCPGTLKQRKKAAKAARQLGGPIWALKDPVNGDLWSASHDNAIRVLIEAPTTQGGYAIKVSDRDLAAAVDQVAQENGFHPVREYLDRLKWDGARRMERLFIRYLGAPDTAYTREIARLMLVGAVTRVYEPGHKFDFAVILEGLQGKRKTSFIETLSRYWFAELNGDFHDPKGMVELMQGSWIMEIPELQGFGKADVRTIKAFISAKSDKVRLAYARRAQVYPRQCIFVGSTNDSEYLRDDTGGRRFWPIECSVDEIDIEGLESEIDQVWAEAAYAYRRMRQENPRGNLPLYLTDPDARAEAAVLQESRRVESAEDGLAGRIGEWLDQPAEAVFEDLDTPSRAKPRDLVCLKQIYLELLGGDPRGWNNGHALTIGRAMRRVPGWKLDVNQVRLPKYGKQRVYRRV